MKKFKFSIHPLFILFGIYFAITGKVFSFLVFTISACLHEFGHYYVAEKRGYRLSRLVLMPYGAVIYGDTHEMTYFDEVVIALSGPIFSLLIAVFFVSFWWLIPDSYPYLESIVLANLTIATINLIPAYPLDGGRVVNSIISLYTKPKTALKISKTIGIILGGGFVGLFIYSLIIKTPNISILMFGLFIIFGNVCVSKDLVYKEILSYFTIGNLKVPKEIKIVAINSKITVKELKNYYVYGKLLMCFVYNDNGKLLAKISPEGVIKILSSGRLYEPVFNVYLSQKS